MESVFRKEHQQDGTCAVFRVRMAIKKLRKEVYITCENTCIRLSNGKDIAELKCHQEETDARIFLHA